MLVPSENGASGSGVDGLNGSSVACNYCGRDASFGLQHRQPWCMKCVRMCIDFFVSKEADGFADYTKGPESVVMD